MSPHFLTNFAVHKNHEPTVTSPKDPLTSFTSNFSRTAQNFVYTRESSIQRSAQAIFVIALGLPSCTVRNTLTTGRSAESSVSCSIWIKVSWKCVHCSSSPGSSSPIQTASDCSLHPEKMSLRNRHGVLPNLHASQPSSQSSQNPGMFSVRIVGGMHQCRFLCLTSPLPYLPFPFPAGLDHLPHLSCHYLRVE